MFRNIVLLVGGLASFGAVPLFAQNAVLGQKYGQGVHDYFAGSYVGAAEQLTAAINGGSKDPRAFYFRGLAYLKLGRPQEAAEDFRKGAQLESSDVNKFYSVAKALERVQGPARVELENYRVDARMATMERAEKLRKARYEAIRREEERVLRMQPLTPPETIATPEATAEPEAAEPFAAPQEKPTEKADKKSAEKPAGDDSVAAPPAAKKGGVLGAMGKALGKAIAGEEKNPPAKEKPAKAENPFGEAPAAKEKPAAEKKPAADAEFDDPFSQ